MLRVNFQSLVRPAVVLGLAALLGGCASALTDPVPQQGAPPRMAQPGWISGVFGNQSLPSGPVADPAVQNRPTAPNCPRVDVREGTETLRTFDAGAMNEQNRLRWQASIVQAARECRSLGAEVNYVVGVTGRVLLGPTGTPGTFQVPVRYVVRRGESDVIFTRLVQVPVTVPAGQTAANFTHVVEDIMVPRDPTDPLANLQIFVGFDPQPERPQRQQRRQPRVAQR